MFIEKKERSQIHLVLSAKGAEGLIATIVMEEVSLSLSLSLSHTHTHTHTHNTGRGTDMYISSIIGLSMRSNIIFFPFDDENFPIIFVLNISVIVFCDFNLK